VVGTGGRSCATNGIPIQTKLAAASPFHGYLAKFRVDGKLALVPPHLVATVEAVDFNTADGHYIWFEFAVFRECHGTPTPTFTFDGGIAE
jgi:hypothetical protein